MQLNFFKRSLVSLALIALSASAFAAPTYHFRYATTGVRAAANTPSTDTSAGTGSAGAQPPQAPGVPDVSFVESSAFFGTVYVGADSAKVYLHIRNTGTALATDDWHTGEAYNIGSQGGPMMHMDSDDPENTCYQDNGRTFYLPAGETCIAPVIVYGPIKDTPGTYNDFMEIYQRMAGSTNFSDFKLKSSIPASVTVVSP